MPLSELAQQLANCKEASTSARLPIDMLLVSRTGQHTNPLMVSFPLCPQLLCRYRLFSPVMLSDSSGGNSKGFHGGV